MKRSRGNAELTQRRKNVDVAVLIREKIVQVGARCSFTYASRRFEAVFGDRGVIRDTQLGTFFKGAASNATSHDRGIAVYETPSRWTRDCVHMALNRDDASTGLVVGSSFERNKTVIPAFDKIYTTCTLIDGTTREWTLNQARDYHLGEYFGDFSSSSTSYDDSVGEQATKRVRSATDENEFVVLGRAAGELSASALSVATVRSLTGGRHFKAMAERLQVHLSRALHVIGGYEQVLEMVVRDTAPTTPAHKAAATLLEASAEAAAATISRRATERESAKKQRTDYQEDESSSLSSSFDARSLLERVLCSESIRRSR